MQKKWLIRKYDIHFLFVFFVPLSEQKIIKQYKTLQDIIVREERNPPPHKGFRTPQPQNCSTRLKHKKFNDIKVNNKG